MKTPSCMWAYSSNSMRKFSGSVNVYSGISKNLTIHAGEKNGEDAMSRLLYIMGEQIAILLHLNPSFHKYGLEIDNCLICLFRLINAVHY
jgi:hypothetical protein